MTAIEVLEDRVAELENGLREVNDAYAAMGEDLQMAMTRVALYDKQRSDLFYRLSKRLPKGWQGQSAKKLHGAGFGGALNAILVESLDWLNEQAIRKHPAPTVTLDPAVVDLHIPMQGLAPEPPMGGTLR